MSARKAVVEAYIDGFRRGDHQAILSCLTEDVVWEIHGHATVHGREEFAGVITEDATPGLPTLELERLVEEGDTVVAVGNGSVAPAAGWSSSSATCPPSQATASAPWPATRST